MSKLFKIQFVVNDRSVGGVSWPRSAPLTVETLQELLVEKESYLQGCELVFSWRDDNDDEVLIENDSDLKEAIQAQIGGESNLLSLLVNGVGPTAPYSAACSEKSLPDKTAKKNPPAPATLEKTKPLAHLSADEVVRIFEKLHVPFACCALARKIPIGGNVLTFVTTVEDLRDCGLTEDVLGRIHAKMLLQNVLDMQKTGVSACLLACDEDKVKSEPSSVTISPSVDSVPVAVAVLVEEDSSAADTKLTNEASRSQKPLDDRKERIKDPKTTQQKPANEKNNFLDSVDIDEEQSHAYEDLRNLAEMGLQPVCTTKEEEQQLLDWASRAIKSHPPILAGIKKQIKGITLIINTDSTNYYIEGYTKRNSKVAQDMWAKIVEEHRRKIEETKLLSLRRGSACLIDDDEEEIDQAFDEFLNSDDDAGLLLLDKECEDFMEQSLDDLEKQTNADFTLTTVSGQPTNIAAELWFPSSRSCTCCDGYKHACKCVRIGGFIACQKKACCAQSDLGVERKPLAGASSHVLRAATPRYCPPVVVRKPGRIPSNGAKLWFPDSRDCVCCQGYKHACECVTSYGYVACQNDGCCRQEFSQVLNQFFIPPKGFDPFRASHHIDDDDDHNPSFYEDNCIWKAKEENRNRCEYKLQQK